MHLPQPHARTHLSLCHWIENVKPDKEGERERERERRGVSPLLPSGPNYRKWRDACPIRIGRAVAWPRKEHSPVIGGRPWKEGTKSRALLVLSKDKQRERERERSGIKTEPEA